MLAARDGLAGRLFAARSRRPGETQLVTIRIRDMKKPLPPLRVARRGMRPVPGGDQTGIERIDVGFVKDQASPPRPAPFCRLRDQVEKIGACAKAGEGCVFSAMDQLKSQQLIELDGAP